MVLRRPEGGRTKVGGLLWVSQRLYPLVQAACPDHPLLKETRREVLDDLLDAPTALCLVEIEAGGTISIARRAVAVHRRLDRRRRAGGDAI